MMRIRRRARSWDVARRVLACLAVAAVAGTSRGNAQVAAPAAASIAGQERDRTRVLLERPGITLRVVRPSVATGLVGAVLRIERGGVARDVVLDGTATGRRARGISEVRLLEDVGRAVLHLDRDHEASGLIVVDLRAGVVVDAVVGRDLTPSPDGRYWAFEEYASRTIERWPHTETVYALYDAGGTAGANARACPGPDDRCRGEVLFLPDRLTLCHEIATTRGGSCLATADKLPRHERRSPFAWLSPREVAWVDVDLARGTSTLVVAAVREGAPAVVRAVALERAQVIEDVEFPPAREAWTIERITRDADRSRVWLHFRTRVADTRLPRLGVRVS